MDSERVRGCPNPEHRVSASHVDAPGEVEVSAHSHSDYSEQRQLRGGAAGWVLLAGLGVAYVISGDFAGWNFGLKQGGGADWPSRCC